MRCGQHRYRFFISVTYCTKVNVICNQKLSTESITVEALYFKSNTFVALCYCFHNIYADLTLWWSFWDHNTLLLNHQVFETSNTL